MIRPADVYLDHCPEVDRHDAPDLNVWEIGDACEGCPIGGGLDCPGTWRWAGSNAIVTQAELEAAAIEA